MQKQFLIRTVALKLLGKLYLSSDCYFKATINAFEFVDENVDKATIQKAGLYLSHKNLIESTQMACDNWTATVKPSGVDWLEDCHNINPCG